MAEYKWPDEGKRLHIGKRISRIDGPEKVSGRAKYSYDINRPGMLHGKILRSPYAHAKIVSIDTSVAEKMPGVKAVKIIPVPNNEIQWAGLELVAVAAETEAQAEDAVRAIKQASSPHGFNVGLNLGAVAGGSLSDHLHQHVVPRWGGDANFITVLAQTKVIPQLLAETRDLIAAAWPRPAD